MRQLEILVIVLIIVVAVALVVLGVVKSLDHHDVGLANLDEFKASTDPNDSDGIVDSVDSNLCTGLGADVTFKNVTVTEGNVATCRASSSIAVHSTIVVKNAGMLELLAPKVEFLPGFSLTHGGVVNVQSVNPNAIRP